MKIGNVELKWLGHSGFLISTAGGKNIFIDPYQISIEEKADVILITHPHYDHCSLQDLEKIIKPGTVVVVPADCQSKITRLEGVEMQVIMPKDVIEVKGVKVQAVPAYNIDKQFHSQNEGWVGYVVNVSGSVIYHAGDTDKIPEMEKLVGHRGLIALLPVGGTYTMNAEQAAEAASIIKPSLAVPIHYGSVVGSEDDAKRFVELCKEKGVRAEILEKGK